MNKEQSIKSLQVSAILFKYNVPVNEARIIGSFIEELIQENQKQKEVIDRLIKIIYEIDESIKSTGGYPSHYMDDLLNIVKEVE